METNNSLFENYVPIKSKEQILKELEPKDVNITTDVFEEIILQDIAMGDDRIKIKLSRNLTKEFTDWVYNTIKNKEQIKINIKGATRCFDKDTLVLTKNGYKKICEINLNDEVYSLNEKTKTLELKKILNVFEYKQQRQKLVKFIMKGGLIISTYGHEFYKNGKWIKNYEFKKRILGKSQKFKWELFCEQFRAIENSELEKLQKRTNNETCFRWKWLSKNYDLSKWQNANYQNTQVNCTTFHKKSFQQRRSKSQRFQQIKQSSIQFRVGNKKRKFTTYYNSQQTCKKFWFEKWKFQNYRFNSKKNSQRISTTKSYKSSSFKKIQSTNISNKIYPLQRVEAFEINENNILDIQIYEDIIDVYDLEVQDNHNYIVTKNNIIVHNSGKSQIGIRVCSLINVANISFGNIKEFTAQKVICGNQKILRQRLNDAGFGDFFQIDENAFANVGSGAHTEMQQLKDINNIIAKQNIHMIYITPQVFLPTGATTGLAYFGKDTSNWVSRFLLYSLKGTIPSLLGYVLFDVGKNFSDNGCFIYKQIGGCTNPTRTKFENIDKDYIYHSCAIDKNKIIPENLILDGKSCPFYNICNSFNCSYEHIKDDWIAKEMKGGIGEREREKLEVAIMLFKVFATFNVDKGQFRLNAKNGKELKLKIKMKLPTLINTKYTGVEIDDIIQTTISLLDREFLKDTCEILGISDKDIINEMMQNLNNDENLEPQEVMENKNLPKSKVNDEIISQIRKDKKLYADLIEYGVQLLEEKNKPIEIQKELNFDEENNGNENELK